MKAILRLVLALCLCLVGAASAQVPVFINDQGRLVDNDFRVIVTLRQVLSQPGPIRPQTRGSKRKTLRTSSFLFT